MSLIDGAGAEEESGGMLTLAARGVMGWRNFFSSCAVVSVFGSGGK